MCSRWAKCHGLAVPPGCIHTSQRPIPAHVQLWEPPSLPHSVPMSGNGSAHFREHASTSGDHQEAPRACQALPCSVHLPLQPLAKLPLYTADHKQCTKSPAAVKPSGDPFCMPGPHAQPLSLLPRGEGTACPMGHAPSSRDSHTIPRGFCLRCMLQLPHCQPPAEPPPFGMASRRCSKPQLSKRQLGHQST